MVINIRGTGGSGKSTIVRTVMERYVTKLPAKVEGRKQPISYLLQSPGLRDLRVLGHYETPCGGCDTISSPGLVYEHANHAVDLGENLLFEGIIIGDDVTRFVDLSKKTTALVIGLNTPMEECLRSIQERRDGRGDIRPLDPKNTLSRAERLKRIMSRLKDAGVKAQWMSRAEALDACMMLLGLGQLGETK